MLSILLALIFLREGITGTKIVSVLLIGIEGIDSNLGTAIRTTVVLLMAWLMVFVTGKQKEIKAIEKKELCFICLSGLATGASWLCYYRALQEGQASVVVPIDKLSMLVTIAFSWIVFQEKLTKGSGRRFVDYSRNGSTGDYLKSNLRDAEIEHSLNISSSFYTKFD